MEGKQGLSEIKRDYMIDESGNPHIVDWAAAIIDKEFFIYPFFNNF